MTGRILSNQATDIVISTGRFEKVEQIYKGITMYKLEDMLEFLRSNMNIHIIINKNAVGWYWGMCKVDSGTDLGWCDDEVDDIYEAYNKAISAVALYPMPNSLSDNGLRHWGLYASMALKKLDEYEEKQQTLG